ncbi:uncharacterized protein TNCV_2759401 [Trichonephila clavipes]|nr:uncharacterized protein TNCV_2759401 [Trichonephila clavipes]
MDVFKRHYKAMRRLLAECPREPNSPEEGLDFEPRSSDEDDTRAWTPSLNLHTTPSVKEYNIGRCEFSPFFILSQTIRQKDDVLTYGPHLNALYSDFEIRFENALIMVIPQEAMNHMVTLKKINVIFQEELIGIGSNEDLKVKFRNGCQQH